MQKVQQGVVEGVGGLGSVREPTLVPREIKVDNPPNFNGNKREL
jgi:hypothetical protein